MLKTNSLYGGKMKNSKLTMFCAYAMCFIMVLVINNQFEVVINNMKYIIVLLMLGYGFVALMKLSNDKRILGNWIRSYLSGVV